MSMNQAVILSALLVGTIYALVAAILWFLDRPDKPTKIIVYGLGSGEYLSVHIRVDKDLGYKGIHELDISHLTDPESQLRIKYCIGQHTYILYCYMGRKPIFYSSYYGEREIKIGSTEWNRFNKVCKAVLSAKNSLEVDYNIATDLELFERALTLVIRYGLA